MSWGGLTKIKYTYTHKMEAHHGRHGQSTVIVPDQVGADPQRFYHEGKPFMAMRHDGTRFRVRLKQVTGGMIVKSI